MKCFWLLLSFLILASCQSPSSEASSSVKISANDPHIRYTGRFLPQGEALRYAWSGSRIDLRFTGPSATILLSAVQPGAARSDSADYDYYHLVLDGEGHTKRLSLASPITFSNLEEGPHDLTIFKRTEARVAEGIFEGVLLAPGQTLLPLEAAPSLTMEFIGNSITCGYGNEGDSKDCPFSAETENAWLTYSHLTAQNLGAQYVSVCYSGKGLYQNYDKTREALMPELWKKYSPASDRVWDFSWIPDVVVVNLGTNDFAHAEPPREEFVRSYQEFLREIIQQYPDTKIVCLTGSMMTGTRLETLKSYLEEIVSEFSAEQVYRFDLSPQGALGMGCNWHPNVAQHTKNAQELTAFLSNLMQE